MSSFRWHRGEGRDKFGMPPRRGSARRRVERLGRGYVASRADVEKCQVTRSNLRRRVTYDRRARLHGRLVDRPRTRKCTETPWKRDSLGTGCATPRPDVESFCRKPRPRRFPLARVPRRIGVSRRPGRRTEDEVETAHGVLLRIISAFVCARSRARAMFFLLRVVALFSLGDSPRGESIGASLTRPSISRGKQ